MGIFLRLPHWVIFLLTFGMLSFAYIAVIFSYMDRHLLLTAHTICFVFANFWRYAIGTRLHKKRYYNSIMLLIFRWCLYFSTLVNAARFVVFPAIDYYFDGAFNTFANVAWVGGGIYCDYFLARMLVSAEQRRDVSLRDFPGTFLSFVFFPIGVWWLQPRVNNVFSRGEQIDRDTPLDYKLDEPA